MDEPAKEGLFTREEGKKKHRRRKHKTAMQAVAAPVGQGIGCFLIFAGFGLGLALKYWAGHSDCQTICAPSAVASSSPISCVCK